MTETTAEPGIRRDLYDLLTGDEDARVCRDIPEIACREQPRNFFIHIGSLVATRTGDLLSSPKVVLSWLLIHLGAPTFMLGFLVPVRESLSLLPQLFIAGCTRRVGVRKWFWVIGSLIQGAAVITMALVAVTLVVRKHRQAPSEGTEDLRSRYRFAAHLAHCGCGADTAGGGCGGRQIACRRGRGLAVQKKQQAESLCAKPLWYLSRRTESRTPSWIDPPPIS